MKNLTKLTCFFMGMVVALILIIAVVASVFGEKATGEMSEADYVVKEYDKTSYTTISVDEIEEKLNSIGEFATYEYTYMDEASIENKLIDSKYVWDAIENLTKHRIDVNYCGVIKAGVKVEDMCINVEGKKILIKLPNVEILDNYIEDYETVDYNNFVNPIDTSEVTDLLDLEKARHLEKAKRDGLEKMARDNAKQLVKQLLSGFEGYRITIE